MAVCSESFIFLRNINDSEQTAKAHDVQIRSQADSLTAQAATRSAKAHDVQIRSQAATPVAQAAERSAKVRGAQIRRTRKKVHPFGKHSASLVENSASLVKNIIFNTDIAKVGGAIQNSGGPYLK